MSDISPIPPRMYDACVGNIFFARFDQTGPTINVAAKNELANYYGLYLHYLENGIILGTSKPLEVQDRGKQIIFDLTVGKHCMHYCFEIK